MYSEDPEPQTEPPIGFCQYWGSGCHVEGLVAVEDGPPDDEDGLECCG